MPNYKQQIIDSFDRRTDYDGEGIGHDLEAKELLKCLDIVPEKNILDLATGTGLVAIDIAQNSPNSSIIGVDISSGMLAQAEAKITNLGIENLQLIQADIESIEFSSEQFDYIFCCSAIMYIQDIPKLIDKCYSWLKPNGYFAFSTSYKTAYNAELKVKICQEILDIDFPHINRPLWTAEKCKTILERANFGDIQTKLKREGKYVYREDGQYIADWDGQDVTPHHSLSWNLTSRQKELLRTEYQKEIDKSVSDRGLWLDKSKLFVKARKLNN